MDDYIGILDETGATVKMPALDLAGNFACKQQTRVGIGSLHFVMVGQMSTEARDEKIAEVRAWLAEQAAPKRTTAKRKVKDENKTD
jgi:hypothetical protein